MLFYLPLSVRKSISGNDILFIKSFNGSNTSDMMDYIRPTLKHDPKLLLVHVGANDIRSEKDPLQIASDIIDLATHVKTSNDEVIISSLVVRRDSLNRKGMAVNEILKTKCAEHDYGFCDNSNITLRDLNQSGLHLSENSTWKLARNFINCIKI